MKRPTYAPDGGAGFRGQTFYEVLTAAVADMATAGFDSEERMERWLLRLRIAAEREVGSPEQVDAQVRMALGEIYGRLIDKGQINKYVPGVARYTIAMIRPQLRAELDRRIMASADLIRLHRQEAVDKTLQRFQGWGTSIPPGGDTTVDRVDVKALTGKALKQFRFEQRRVAIDQGMKLISNVSEIVATDNGAIAAEWLHVHRGPSYDSRPEHLKRDGKFFAVRGSWAWEQGLVDKSWPTTDEIERPAFLPFCSCQYRYITSPRRVPEDMLTAKGKAWIEKGKKAA